MNAIRPFSEGICFPVSICNYLIDSLDQRLTSIFCYNYPDYGQPHDMLASHQRSWFPIILCAMQLAEEEVQNYMSIARNAIGVQAFHSNATVRTLNCYSTERVKGTDGFNSDATKSQALLLDGMLPALGVVVPIPGCATRSFYAPTRTVLDT
jgi:hypothetical protein